MSILKGILHHWNKTNKNYDTIHPETESAQITDWHSGIMASLASKTLGTVVDAITTDSVLGKLIKMLLNASGVKYLIDTNGYICFGSFFGGLIIQWGTVAVGKGTDFEFPISFTRQAVYAGATHFGSVTGITLNVDCTEKINGGHIYTNYSGTSPLMSYYFAIGI